MNDENARPLVVLLQATVNGRLGVVVRSLKTEHIRENLDLADRVEDRQVTENMFFLFRQNEETATQEEE